MTGYAKHMMVEIKVGVLAGQWGKLDRLIAPHAWLVRFSRHGLLEFTESEFTSSDFHKAHNDRILSKHNKEISGHRSAGLKG